MQWGAVVVRLRLFRIEAAFAARFETRALGSDPIRRRTFVRKMLTFQAWEAQLFP